MMYITIADDVYCVMNDKLWQWPCSRPLCPLFSLSPSSCLFLSFSSSRNHSRPRPLPSTNN